MRGNHFLALTSQTKRQLTTYLSSIKTCTKHFQTCRYWYVFPKSAAYVEWFCKATGKVAWIARSMHIHRLYCPDTVKLTVNKYSIKQDWLVGWLVRTPSGPPAHNMAIQSQIQSRNETSLLSLASWPSIQIFLMSIPY